MLWAHGLLQDSPSKLGALTDTNVSAIGRALVWPRVLVRFIRSTVSAAVVGSVVGGCAFPDFKFVGGADSVDSLGANGGKPADVENGGDRGAGANDQWGADLGDAGTQNGGQGAAGQSATGGNGTGGSGGANEAGGGNGLESELCLNWQDDNGDTWTDCMDPQCADETYCASGTAAGWLGYVVLVEGDPSRRSSGLCPAGYPYEAFQAYEGLAAGNATCTPCTCGAPTDQSCTPPDSVLVTNVICGGSETAYAELSLPTLADGSCFGDDLVPGGDWSCGGACNRSIAVPDAVVSGGSCVPSGATLAVNPVVATRRLVACTPLGEGAGCGLTESCLPQVPESLADGLCIYRLGDHECPLFGPFKNRHLLHDNFTDTRGCDACECSSPSGGACAVTVSMFEDTATLTCQDLVTTVTSGECVNLSGNPTLSTRSAVVSEAPSGGSCQASGGALQGAFAVSGPITACCGG
jgi:hypothetical protein